MLLLVLVLGSTFGMGLNFTVFFLCHYYKLYQCFDLFVIGSKCTVYRYLNDMGLQLSTVGMLKRLA